MTKNYFFTVNLLIKSDTNINKAIQSVIGDGKFFSENVQLIIIDSIGTETSENACSRYNSLYPDNVWFIDAVGKNEAEGFNSAKPIIMGEYTSFIDNYGSYDKGSLKTAMKLLASGRIPALAMQPFCSAGKGERIPYATGIEKGVVSLIDTPDRFILLPGCYFFKRNAINGISFRSSDRFHCGAGFIIETMLKIGSYVYTDSCSYTTCAATEKDPIRYKPQYNRNFYTRTIRDFVIPCLKDSPDSALVQSAMMYIIGTKLSLNTDELDKGVLSGSRLDEFLDAVSDALRYIDDAVIINPKICRSCGLDNEMPFRLLRMKYRNSSLFPEIDTVPPDETQEYRYYTAPNRMESFPMSGELAAHVNRALIVRSKNITAEIAAINFENGSLIIDAVLNGCSCFPDNDLTVYAVVNGERKKAEPTRVYTTKKYFGRPFLRRYSFSFSAAVSSGKKMDTISLSLRCGKLTFRIGMTFSGLYSKLSSEIRSSYFTFGDRHVSYDAKTKSLVVRRASESFLAVSENRFMREAGAFASFGELLGIKHIRRTAVSIKRGQQNKKLFLFYDGTGINHNGNLLFRYFYKNRTDGFEPYFVTERGSHEYVFLKDTGYDNILEAGSLRAKATAISADIIFATDCDPYDSIGFNDADKLLLRDMIKARVVSAKNFFLTWNSSMYDNRLRDNTRLVLCSSKRERDNLLNPVFGYTEDMVRITGMPMLDAVSDKKDKLIVIAPGERSLYGIYEHSDNGHFSESAFCKAYSSLLLDRELNEVCREKGWNIAFMLPHSLEKYLKMFPGGDTVKLYPSTEQSEAALVSKGAVLITDYSELQYRFAYLDKNVTYFFPDGLPKGSEHKGENLEKNGFGRIITDGNELCEFLKAGIADGFPVEAKYSSRSRSFFRNKDRSNCRRIFETITSVDNI